MYIFKRGTKQYKPNQVAAVQAVPVDQEALLTPLPLVHLALLGDLVVFEALPVLEVLVNQEGQVHLMQISISIPFS